MINTHLEDMTDNTEIPFFFIQFEVIVYDHLLHRSQEQHHRLVGDKRILILKGFLQVFFLLYGLLSLLEFVHMVQNMGSVR